MSWPIKLPGYSDACVLRVHAPGIGFHSASCGRVVRRFLGRKTDSDHRLGSPLNPLRWNTQRRTLTDDLLLFLWLSLSECPRFHDVIECDRTVVSPHCTESCGAGQTALPRPIGPTTQCSTRKPRSQEDVAWPSARQPGWCTMASWAAPDKWHAGGSAGLQRSSGSRSDPGLGDQWHF